MRNATDLSSANSLVEEHLYLVQHVVNSLASRFPRHVDRGELWSAGAHGLVDASRRYDPDAGIPFARYATIRIRGAILDSTRTRDWATRSLRREMRTVREAEAAFSDTHGRTPDSVELAATLGMTPEKLAAHQAAAATANLLHLDHTVSGGEEGDSTLAERLEERDSSVLPEDSLENQELIGTARSAVEHLPEVQREVVERYYFGGELLRDIADSLGVTEARVSQIRSEALLAMRSYFGTTFEGVPGVAANAPGLRRRASYVADVAASTTWRTRLDAGHGESRKPAAVNAVA